MSQLVISRSSTSATVGPPPPTIIQAPMRILEQPTPTTTPLKTSSVSPSPVPQTPVERVGKYQEARERIFGPSRHSNQDGPTTKTPPPRPVPNAIRNLLDQTPMLLVMTQMGRRGSVINAVGGLRSLEGRGCVCVVTSLMRNHDPSRLLGHFA